MSVKGLAELLSSIFLGCVVTICLTASVSTNLVEPLIHESRLVVFGRYSFQVEALDSIAEDDSVSVVSLGSSMIFAAFDGQCLTDSTTVEGSQFYNLGVPASRPYTDMMQIPRLVRSGVDLVVMEIGVNLLFKMKDGPHEYLEYRFTTQTMVQEDSDVGEWVDLVLPYHKRWLYLNEVERTKAKQEWMVEASEVHLSRWLGTADETDIGFRFLPQPGSEEWMDYLRRPGWSASKLDNMNAEKYAEYNETILMKRSSYRPLSEGTGNHEAMEYILSELQEADIKVILVGLPHHPLVYPNLDAGQWDGYNDTLHYMSNKYGTSYVDFTFEEREGWEFDHFSDKNHLDEEGRLEFCQRMSPIIDEHLRD